MSSSDKTESRKHKKEKEKGREKERKERHKSSKHHKKESKKKHKDTDKERDKDRDRGKSSRRDRDRDHTSREERNSSRDVVPISEDDYFLKNEEFRVWLHVSKSISFETLTTVQAREIFAGDFCRSWNKGSLAAMYYEGTIPTELRHQCVKSTHKWGLKLSENEKEQVNDLAYRVESSTRKQFKGAWNHMAQEQPPPPPPSGSSTITPFANLSSNNSSKSGCSSGKRSLSHGDDQLRREEQLKEEKSERKRQRYYEREKANVIMDEIAPKATGREAQIDKRREAGARIQGAAADRDAGRDGMEMSEDITMGGGDDYASMKARRQQGQQRREERKQDRIRYEANETEEIMSGCMQAMSTLRVRIEIEDSRAMQANVLQDKEKDKTQNFMNQLGIDFSKGPIKIQPR